MSRVGSRVEGLEARRAKRSPATPMTREARLSLSALLKAQDAARRVLDGLEPDPANEPTDEERAFQRSGRPARLAYLELERDRFPPDAPMRDVITAAIDQTRADMEAEETEIMPDEQQRGAT